MLLIGGGLGWGVIVLISMLTGRFALENDNRFVEFHMCRDATHYAPVQTIPMGVKTLYVCGIIEGRGPRGAVLYLYSNNQLIDVDYYFEHYPGIFFERFSLDQGLQVGQYQIKASSAKLVIAETEFSVVKE